MSNKGGIKGKPLLEFSVVDLKHPLPPIWNHVRPATWDSFTCILGLFHKFWGKINQRESTQTSLSQLESSPTVNIKHAWTQGSLYCTYQPKLSRGNPLKSFPYICIVWFLLWSLLKLNTQALLNARVTLFCRRLLAAVSFIDIFLESGLSPACTNYELGWWLKA